MFRFRTAFDKLTPGWQNTGDGEKVLWALSVILDAYTSKVRAGLEARFPRRAGASALALTGADRGIIRGRDETNAHYAARLVRWRQTHRVRGNAFALLEQISEYFGGIRAWVIDRKGRINLRTAAGVQSYSYGNAWNWDGVAELPRWARFWIVIDGTGLATRNETYAEAEAAGLTYAEAKAQSRTYGQRGVSFQDCEAIRRLMRGRAWKPAGVRAEWAIVSFDGSAPVPDGTWGNYQGRDPLFSYWYLGR